MRPPIPIAIDGGLVCGVWERNGACTVYKGIPFAAPPVGELRWRAPQAARPWSDVLVADRFASACLQPLHARDALLSQFGFAEPPECGMSEDCLYLNVWTPASRNGERLPVIVWVHGGGHRVGAGSHPVSRGEVLAEKGAVVVTLNYRLGALGYLAHPQLTREAGASGNYACMDVIAALQWVQRNIVAFGGDPRCVTLFGQSAGAAIVSVLMVSQRAKGLFQRAIVHSSGRFRGGPMGHTKSLAEAEEDGVKFTQGLGASTLTELRNLPADALYGPRGIWNLIVDGEILRDEVQVFFEHGSQMDVPVLCGFTRNEATPYPMAELHGREKFLEFAHRTFGAAAGAFLALFPHDNDAAASLSSYEVRRSMGFAYQPWKLAQLQQRTARAPVYLFEFDRSVPLPPGQRFHEAEPPGGFGAYHGSELWYVFNTLPARPWPWTETDRRLADVMSTYWVNFARTGDPNDGEAPRWPPFEAGRGAGMLLGDTLRAGAPSNSAALEFFDEQFNAAKR